ncbi:GumC family protein [Azorhizobium doebereinerae]|uniref:GumC family protein n=1 Tax=Azorhizobium doebereinerae TaxID=281091 RepID=UPI0003FE25D3|nr:lipopolysaccharide biosynthesis protein [Azorhizobium doebereinerae]
MTGSQVGELDVHRPAFPGDMRPPSFTLRDFLIAAFFHRRVVVLGALLPILVGIGASVLTKTEYTASSLLLVMVNREVATQNVTDTGPAVLSIEGLKQVESEVQIIDSADVIHTTIEQVGLERLFPPSRFSFLAELMGGDISTMDRAIERFRKNTRTTVLSGSNIIQVSVTNPNRDVAIKATDELVKAYLEYRRKVFDNPTASILMVEVERFKSDLTRTDDDIEALKKKAGIIEFSQDAVLAANQVDSVLQRRRQVAERKAAVSAQLATAEEEMKALPETVFDFTQKSDASGNDDDRNILTRLLVERDRLATQFAPGSPPLREIDRKIETVRQVMAGPEPRLYSTNRDVRNPAISYMNNMVLSLRVELDSLSRQEDELARQETSAEERLATLRSAETRLVELNRQRETLSEGYREYLRRAVAAKVEETASKVRASNVRVVEPAGAAVTGRSMALPFLAAGLFGGVLFGAAAGAIASALRTGFIQPSEPERLLGLPCLAEFGDGPNALETVRAEQAVGSLATLLLDSELDGRPLRALHFLAQEPHPDIPAFCRRLAEEFATQRGMRTLLVNLNSPSRDTRSDTPAEAKGGLAISSTIVPLLWSADDSDRSPFLSVRLPMTEGRRMMKELEDQFDAIIICSSAQAASSVKHRLNRLVDANILLIRAEETRKPAAMRLRSDVMESGGILMGFVFMGRKYYLPNWIYRIF